MHNPPQINALLTSIVNNFSSYALPWTRHIANGSRSQVDCTPASCSADSTCWWFIMLVRSLNCFNLLSPSSRTMSLGRTQLLAEISTRNIPVVIRWQPQGHLWAEYLENVGSSTSHTPTCLHSQLQEYLYFLFLFYWNASLFSVWIHGMLQLWLKNRCYISKAINN
jgi:hypothetical protein